MSESEIAIKVPSAGESVQEAMIGTWLKQDGDHVQQDEPLVELETDKASMEICAEQSGVLKIQAAEGDVVKVGDVIAILAKEPQSVHSKIRQVAAEAEKNADKMAETTQSSAVLSSSVSMGVQNIVKPLNPGPAVSQVAAELKTSVADLQAKIGEGSGRQGRLTKGDVKAYQASSSASRSTSSADKASPPQASVSEVSSTVRRESREPMTMIRRRIAQRLLAATQDTAMLTTFNEVDMSVILDIRKTYRDQFLEIHGEKLGFMGFFIKASVQALQSFPRINSQIQQDEVVSFSYCDVGVAVSTPKGLVVPVVRDAQNLSLAQIEHQVAEYARRARDKKLSIQDMEGGTFTLTNGGVFGSLLSTPILNPPQSAILGMHKIQMRPVVLEDGSIVARPMMYLALSYDHRIVDGRDAVQFLVAIKKAIEDPHCLLLNV